MTVLLICFAPLLLSPNARGQTARPKRVMVLYWYDKDYPANIQFDQSFQKALQSAPAGSVEYYAEYLETNRFRGETAPLALRDYLRQKYAEHPVDVVVALPDTPLNFLLKYRDLFPNTPIVFVAVKRPSPDVLLDGAGLTGIVTPTSHRQTLDLALTLHPETRQVFVVSGTPERDKRFEITAREQLEEYNRNVAITYLTDLSLNELVAKIKTLPERSLVLYLWQQDQNEQGVILESADVLSIIARSAHVPIYGMSSRNIGSGLVGGYVVTSEGNATRVAEITLQILRGARAQDIPVQDGPVVPMFDWNQLQRLGIGQDRLPPGSVIRFREPSFWELYRWRIIGVISLFLVEAFLIFALLVQRSRRGRAEEELRLSEERFSKAFRASPDAVAIVRRSDGTLLEVNDSWQAILGYSINDTIGRTTLDLGMHIKPEDREKFYTYVQENDFIRDFEVDLRSKTGELRRVNASAESITINKVQCLVVIIRDITERKRAEDALRESEEALRESHRRVEDLAGRLIAAQEDERKHIARELHDDLNQRVAAMAISLAMLKHQLSDGPVRTQLLKLETRITGLSEQIRRLSHELHSSTLEHVGLIEALKLQCSESIEQQGLEVSFDMNVGDKELDSDVALCLYRVAQESLRNVAKHSGATRAELSLVMNDASVVMRITDQGKGFDLEKQRRGSGIGLTSIQERVRLVGGFLEVKSQLGAGTELKVSVPVRRPEQNARAVG